MTFIHASLLGGLLLAGLPILLHFLLRKKPRRILFPAFRFLEQRRRVNQRRLRLQHLLLLALRVLVIAALCLGLARPEAYSEFLSPHRDRPVVAVFVIDTSLSMQYKVGGVTRLADAQRRAHELLDRISPKGSLVAVLDSADSGENAGPLVSHAEARERINALRPRPEAGSLNVALERAFARLDGAKAKEGNLPRFLYVFSDRTRASWSPGGPARVPDGVQAVYVDLGPRQPIDLSVEKVELNPPLVRPGGRFEVLVTVRSTAREKKQNVLELCHDRSPTSRVLQRLPVTVLPDRRPTDLIVFEGQAPTPPEGVGNYPYPLTVQFVGPDSLEFNNSRHATLLVRRGRKQLVVLDRKVPERFNWWAAVNGMRNFQAEIKQLDAVESLAPTELSAYPIITLFQLRRLPDELAKKLRGYVNAGGGLIVVPAGEGLTPGLLEAFNKNAGADGLLPARLERLVSAPDDRPAVWSDWQAGHPLTEPLARLARTAPGFDFDGDLRPAAHRYWKLAPAPGSVTVATFAGGDPALMERPVGKGHVVLLSTPMDTRTLGPDTSEMWHNYWYGSFGVVLIDRIGLFLAGERSVPELDFPCGDVPAVPVPGGDTSDLRVTGPKNFDARLPANTLLRVPTAREPGNYLVRDDRGRVRAGFSVNARVEESDLTKVDKKDIEAILGPRSVLVLDQGEDLSKALQALRPPPRELLPYLMLLLLLLLAGEAVLANTFYRRSDAAPSAGEPRSREAAA
jgi:hypothetical protein